MKWNKKNTSLITGIVGLAFIGLILVQIIHINQGIKREEQIFTNTVSGALNSIVQKLETKEMMRRMISVSVGEDSSGLFSTTTMHLGTKDKYPIYLKNTRRFQSDVKLDSNSLILHLRKQRHVELQELDNHKKIVQTVVDSIMDAGIHGIPIDRYGKTQYTLFNVAIDGNPYHFSLDKSSPGRLVIDPELDLARRALVDKVIEQYLVFEAIPIQERIEFAVLDSIVHITLNEFGVKEKAQYGIISTNSDSIIYTSGPVDSSSLLKSTFKTQIYPHDVYVEPNELSLWFPELKTILRQRVLTLSAITGLLIILIIASFVVVVRATMNQTRFSKLLVDFINNMTHEFKTPLSTITIASESIIQNSDKSDPQRLQKFGGIIHEESGRMRKQVEKILDMAALERGDVELNFEIIDIHKLVKQAGEHFQLAVEQQNGKLDCYLKANNHHVKADKVHLMNCIYNLLDNAVKYVNTAPKIKVATENVDNHCKISVTDNGIGLKQEEIKRIFQKYYRVPTGNVHNVKGFGLGLSYVKLLIEAHNGSVYAKSTVDKGSEFSIYIPFTKIVASEI